MFMQMVKAYATDVEQRLYIKDPGKKFVKQEDDMGSKYFNKH